MKSLQPALIGIIATVVVIGIAAVIAFQVMADPERLMKLAKEKVRAALSRDVAIGAISLRLLPWPVLSATNVEVAEVPKDPDPWRLHADRVSVSLAFWPLLSGEARPRAVQLEGDIVRHGRKVRVIASLDDVSNRGDPDAASDGKVDLDFGKTLATVTGRIPLQPQWRGAAFTARLESPALNDVLEFFGQAPKRSTAPARASLEVRSAGERVDVLNVDLALGKHKATGDARIATAGATPVIDARLRFERMDWAQLLLDAGGVPRDPLPLDEVFYDRPIAWPSLVSLQGKQGTIDAQVATLVLRNGVELHAFKADMAFEGDKLQVRNYTTNLLGGSATGTMLFEGRKKEVHVTFEGKNLLLERWFKERHREIPFTGGPMAISASLHGIGDSMRDLSKSVTGPVTIRMGPGIYASQKAGDAEAVMLAFSKKDSTGQIAFECAAANLPFVQGKASGDAIVGARSDVMRLLASGHVSYQDNTVDLRGRLLPKPGQGAGLAAIAGDIRIGGSIRAMKTTLDPAGTAGAVMRAGAAVATLGLSLAGSVAANNAREDIDPCETVFRKVPVPPAKP